MRPMRSEEGFSLAETIFATFVISLVMMTLFSLFPSSALAVKRAEMTVLADSIAEQHLEIYRAEAFDALTLSGPVNLSPQTIKGVTFQPVVEIVQVPPSDPDLLKSVRITVDWSHSRHNYQTVHEAWLTSVED